MFKFLTKLFHNTEEGVDMKIDGSAGVIYYDNRYHAWQSEITVFSPDKIMDGLGYDALHKDITVYLNKRDCDIVLQRTDSLYHGSKFKDFQRYQASSKIGFKQNISLCTEMLESIFKTIPDKLYIVVHKKQMEITANC